MPARRRYEIEKRVRLTREQATWLEAKAAAVTESGVIRSLIEQAMQAEQQPTEAAS